MTQKTPKPPHDPSVIPAFDRPGTAVPSVDRPWDDPADRAHRRSVIKGDRSAHRVHHALYEDMLN